VDFTWEREWRIRVDQLHIDWHVAQVVVPSKGFFDALRRDHEGEQDLQEEQYRQIFDELTAWQLREHFKWQVHVLDADGSVTA